MNNQVTITLQMQIFHQSNIFRFWPIEIGKNMLKRWMSRDQGNNGVLECLDTDYLTYSQGSKYF